MDVVAGYPRRAAQLLVRLAAETGTDVVPRELLRDLWLAEYPGQARQKLVSEGAKVRRRRRSYLAGATHQAGRSSGLRSRGYMRSALQTLEGLGLVERIGDTVCIVDMAALAAVAGAPRGSTP